MSELPVPASTAVVVSGGSRGLGLTCTRDLLGRGLKVAAFARTVTPELAVLATENPDTLLAGSVDITDQAAVSSFLREAAAAFGPLDGLVNNAAVGQDSLLLHTSADDVASIVDTNLIATLLLTRAFLRQAMAKGVRSRIVIITSICAQRGYSGLTAYAATKGGLEAAARTLAREMHGRALVNCVAPGFFASEMSSVLGTDELTTITRRTPTGALVEPENISPIVQMLLCDETNLNGQVITVDGGSSI